MDKKPRDLIESLHPNQPKHDIRDYKEKFVNEKEDAADIVENLVEINAITSYLIEKIWHKISLKLKTETGLVANRQFIDQILESFPLSDSEIYSSIDHMDDEKVFEFLKKSSQAFFIKEIGNFEPNPEDYQMVTNAYSRLSRLLNTNRRGVNLHIISGLNTSIFTLWEILRAIPKKYESKFRKPIQSSQEYKRLFNNSLPLVYTLASSSLESFTEIEKKYTTYMPEIDYEHFKLEAFTIISKSGVMSLGFSAQTELNLKPIDNPQRVRTGCPALISIGPENKNVIAEMASAILKIAEKYYIPALKRKGLINY